MVDDARLITDRRRFLAQCGAVGVGGTLFPGVLWAAAQEARQVTKAMIAQAEVLAGISLTDEQRESLVRGLNEYEQRYVELRRVDLPNAIAPPLYFDPVVPGTSLGRHRTNSPAPRLTDTGVKAPSDLEAVAFWPVEQLAELVRTRQVTPGALTRMYLGRLKRHGPSLECIVNLTEERALAQARQADDEIAAGRYRGPLHGIPWGAKDLLAVKGYPTTWGAKPYESQVIDEDATVVKRLDAAGAILIAKLTLGALAQGDEWFGGKTRNPWNLEQGSSGSSAGPAAATAAGLVAFGIGSETQGSIVSPAARCGVSGLRPTFGFVPRTGAMTLSWSMDKLGPICRSAADCGIVMQAIHGADGEDLTVKDIPFAWRPDRRITALRVGYLKSAFEADHDDRALDDAALRTLREMGVEPIAVELPGEIPMASLNVILRAEAAAAFDELTRSGRVDLIERSSRPVSFREARFSPAVEYIQANRARTLLMSAMHEAMRGIDLFVTPSFAQGLLQVTNLTGHPAVVVPSGFRPDGTPASISFIGRLYGDEDILLAGFAYQKATDFHERRPPRFS
jgi:Asp-tRNA(Asn)/Glu-tRNA(Gln) amidotransferase A subunit family amidase